MWFIECLVLECGGNGGRRRQGGLFVGRKRVVGVGRDSQGLGGALKGITHRAGVLGSADEDADGGCLSWEPQDVVDCYDIEVQLAQVLWLELTGLQFHDYVPVGGHVIEQQVDVEVVAVDVQVVLAADEREAWPEFRQGLGHAEGHGALLT